MTEIKENTKMNDYTTEKMIEKLKANRGQGFLSRVTKLLKNTRKR